MKSKIFMCLIYNRQLKKNSKKLKKIFKKYLGFYEKSQKLINSQKTLLSDNFYAE